MNKRCLVEGISALAGMSASADMTWHPLGIGARRLSQPPRCNDSASQRADHLPFWAARTTEGAEFLAELDPSNPGPCSQRRWTCRWLQALPPSLTPAVSDPRLELLT